MAFPLCKIPTLSEIAALIQRKWPEKIAVRGPKGEVQASQETCSSCGGSGCETCGSCGGAGYCFCSECAGYGAYRTLQNQRFVCSNCYGSGRQSCSFCLGSGQRSCSACSGSGYVKRDRDLEAGSIARHPPGAGEAST